MGNRLRTLSQIGSLIIVLSVFTAGNALGEEIPSGVFADVASNDRYYKAISSLAEQNIIQGYQDETFRPYQNISRAEGLKMILESLLKSQVLVQIAKVRRNRCALFGCCPGRLV